MKLLILIIFLAQTLIAQVDFQKKERLEEEINEAFEQVAGTFACVFVDLQEPHNALFINAGEEFHAASTMKTPVMLEFFRMQDKGLINLNDSVVVKNEFTSIVDSSLFSLTLGDSQSEGKYTIVGEKVSLHNLIYDMITVSSNLATNVLIEIIGAKQVMKTMMAVGADDIQVLRGVEDLKAYNSGKSNTTTANDLMLIFREIYFHTLVSAESSESMIKILSDQYYNEIIPAPLPEEVTAAHKTGSIQGVVHDSGIVFLPDGRSYIIILLGKEITDMNKAVETEADVSRLIYQYMTDIN